MPSTSGRGIELVHLLCGLFALRVISLRILLPPSLPLIADLPASHILIHISTRDYTNTGRLRSLLPLTFVLRLHHVQPVQLQKYHQRVLAGEEDVHVADDAVVDDEDQAKGQERAVL